MSNKLTHPVDAVSEQHKDHQDHGTPIKKLVGQKGMRVIGRAHDQGIIVPESDAHRRRIAEYEGSADGN